MDSFVVATKYELARASAIGKDVGLYDDSNLLRIVMDCAEISMEKEDNLSIFDFNHLDLLHYQGLGSLELFFKDSNIQNENIIDLGAGVGGSSRFIAKQFNCSVTSVELVDKIVRVGKTLNFFQKLHKQISYYTDDITQLNNNHKDWKELYKIGISQLVFLHIPNKNDLFKSISYVIKPNGLLYVEDFFKLSNSNDKFSDKENEILKDDISVPLHSLLHKNEYILLLENAGFEIIQWNDKTDEWTKFVWDRYENYLKTSNSCSELGWFYQQMTYLFHYQSNNEFYNNHPLVKERLLDILDYKPKSRKQILGGVQYVVRKK